MKKQFTKTLFKVLLSEPLQIFLIWLYLVGFGSFIGYGDVIQNYGSMYNPPDFWLGSIIKILGLIGISIFTMFFYKIYKPISFIQK